MFATKSELHSTANEISDWDRRVAREEKAWWTEWVGKRVVEPIDSLKFRLAYVGLALNAAIATAVALPSLNRAFGARQVWLAGEVVLALGMLLTCFTGPRSFVPDIDHLAEGAHTSTRDEKPVAVL